MKLVFFLLIVQWRLNARTAENFEIMPLSRSWSIWSFAFANFCCILVGHGWWEVLFGMTHSGYSGDNKLCTFNFRYLQGWTSQTVLLTLIRSPDVIAVAKHCLSVDVCWLYFEVSRRYYTSVNWLCAWSCSVLLLFPSSGALGLVCRIPGLCDRTIMQIHGFFDSALSVGEVWLCLLKFPGQVTFCQRGLTLPLEVPGPGYFFRRLFSLANAWILRRRAERRTTPMDPYEKDDCFFDDNVQPHMSFSSEEHLSAFVVGASLCHFGSWSHAEEVGNVQSTIVKILRFWLEDSDCSRALCSIGDKGQQQVVNGDKSNPLNNSLQLAGYIAHFGSLSMPERDDGEDRFHVLLRCRINSSNVRQDSFSEKQLPKHASNITEQQQLLQYQQQNSSGNNNLEPRWRQCINRPIKSLLAPLNARFVALKVKAMALRQHGTINY